MSTSLSVFVHSIFSLPSPPEFQFFFPSFSFHLYVSESSEGEKSNKSPDLIKIVECFRHFLPGMSFSTVQGIFVFFLNMRVQECIVLSHLSTKAVNFQSITTKLVWLLRREKTKHIWSPDQTTIHVDQMESEKNPFSLS